jgi:hypothetical protein
MLPPLAVNSKSEREVNSLPPLGFQPVIIGMLAHLSNNSAKSHPDNLHNISACTHVDIFFNLSTFIAHYPRVSSKRFIPCSPHPILHTGMYTKNT